MDERLDAGVAEVVGGLLMFVLAIAMFLLLANASFQQARHTADYIEALVPKAPPPQDEPGVCIALPEAGTWCRRMPGDQVPVKGCVVDTRGWPWCDASLPPPQNPGSVVP